MSVIERAIVQLGWEVDPKDKRELASFEKSLDTLLVGAAKLGAAFGSLVGLIGGAAAATNKQTAELNNLAKSVGVSIGFLQALGSEAEQIGLDMDRVVDLVEEMNNKLGEFGGLGEMTAVSESLQILNLRFDELKELAPEEQFTRIFDAAKNLKDEQKAVSAVDMLMGGEANKLLGFLRSVDGSLADIIQRRLELNFLTTEGTEGATDFNKSLGFVVDSAKSMWQQFSGLLGASLIPLLDKVQDWIRLNRQLIKQKLQDWSDRMSTAISWLIPKIGWLIDRLGDLFGIVEKVVKSLGGFENAMRLLGIALTSAAILRGIALIRQFGNTVVTAQLKLFAWIALIAGIILLLEDLWKFLEDPDADTVFKKLITAAEEWLGVDIAGPMREAWPEIKEFLAGLWEGFKTAIALIIENVGNFVMFIVDIFDKGIGSAWDSLLARMRESWTALWPGAMEFFDNSVVAPIRSAFEWIQSTLESITTGATSILSRIPLVGRLFDSGEATGAAAQAARASVGVTQQNTTSVTVVAQTGASPQDIGREVRRVVEEENSRAIAAIDTGVEW